jgi:hypothetical protein
MNPVSCIGCFWGPGFIAVARTSMAENTSRNRCYYVMSPRVTESTCEVIPTPSCVTSHACVVQQRPMLGHEGNTSTVS